MKMPIILLAAFMLSVVVVPLESVRSRNGYSMENHPGNMHTNGMSGDGLWNGRAAGGFSYGMGSDGMTNRGMGGGGISSQMGGGGMGRGEMDGGATMNGLGGFQYGMSSNSRLGGSNAAHSGMAMGSSTGMNGAQSSMAMGINSRMDAGGSDSAHPRSGMGSRRGMVGYQPDMGSRMSGFGGSSAARNAFSLNTHDGPGGFGGTSG